ncbi:unnamed protein product [Somion occarium]|uniref:Uncharacterized protein n=1 Tax=Somion occarium TaxID=3059160 RepID=A0ABP1CPT8_9APHY
MILVVYMLLFILLTSCSIVSSSPIPLFSTSGSLFIGQSDILNVSTHDRKVQPFKSIIPSQANSTGVVESGRQANTIDNTELPVSPLLGKRFLGGGDLINLARPLALLQFGSTGVSIGPNRGKGGKGR